MRLSDAIATGRMLLTPTLGVRELNGGGCAIGMAEVALGIEKTNKRLENVYPWLSNTIEDLPCGSDHFYIHENPYLACFNPVTKPQVQSYSCAIAHIFNVHVMRDKTWNLDQLIDWVRSVEPAEKEIKETVSSKEPEYATVT